MRRLPDSADTDSADIDGADIDGADIAPAVLAGLVTFVANRGISLPLHGPGAVLVPVVVLACCLVPRSRETRTIALIGLLLVMIIGHRQSAQLAVIAEPLPEHVGGVGRLVTDPAMKRFDVQAIVDVDGRRYVGSVTPAGSGPFRAMMAGELVRLKGTTGTLQGAPRGWIESNHLVGRLAIESVESDGSGRPWDRLANGLRRRIERGSSSMEADRRALYLGLVVGDDRSQSELQRYRFRAAGLSHLLAVSGQNVAFLLTIISPVLRRLSPYGALALTIPVLILFALVTRAEPSVLRAVVMSLVGLVAITTGRQAQGLRILSVTVIALVLIDPLITRSIGFQLSVLATLGLVLLTRPIEQRLVGPRWFKEPLAVTLAAQVATAPVILAFVGTVPVAGAFANLLAVPVSGLVMMLGLTAGLVAGSVRGTYGDILVAPTLPMLDWIDGVATYVSRLPLPQFGPVPFIVVLLAVGALLVMSGKRDAASPTVRAVASCLAVLAVLVVLRPIDAPRGRTAIAAAVDLWRSECGATVLVIGKGADGISTLEALDDARTRSIDVLLVDPSRSARNATRFVMEQNQPVYMIEFANLSPFDLADLTVEPANDHSANEGESPARDRQSERTYVRSDGTRVTLGIRVREPGVDSDPCRSSP